MPSDAPPLTRLSELKQSVWVDFLSRESIRGGHLQELVDRYSVVGATSNPTIFEKAMSSGDAYDEQLHELAAEGIDGDAVFWVLAEQDIRDACEPFRPVWAGGRGRGGYVPLGAVPRLANDTLVPGRGAQLTQKGVDRPNGMVKIPATKPGLAA